MLRWLLAWAFGSWKTLPKKLPETKYITLRKGKPSVRKETWHERHK